MQIPIVRSFKYCYNKEFKKKQRKLQVREANFRKKEEVYMCVYQNRLHSTHTTHILIFFLSVKQPSMAFQQQKKNPNFRFEAKKHSVMETFTSVKIESLRKFCASTPDTKARNATNPGGLQHRTNALINFT
ncbi:unnamed protein product [Lactuca virosa]|uniref:Uncharacterized protein n=1 Tax=Lactuca virosa TaxID=75947 RepID=A0AAU9N5E9_9ASTR|nr:unnamed protein product [Lactuca virosa]